MRINLGNGEIELAVNFWTVVLYEQQFGSDLIGDLIGRVEIVEDEDCSFLDYGKYNWNESIQAMWAAAKCADSSTEPFEKWCRSMTNLNMWPLVTEFRAEVIARLFRDGATDSE